MARFGSQFLATLLVAGLAASQTAPPGAPPPPSALTPARLDLPELSGWSEPIFVQADRRGRIVFLRSDKPGFAPLLPNGKLGETEKYEGAGFAGGNLLRAMMSRDGDWLTFSPPEIRLYREGKERILPRLEWSAIDIGFLRGDPVVNTDAVRVAPPTSRSRGEAPPLVLRWNGKEWETLIREKIPDKKGPLDPGVREGRTVHLLGDSRGALWLANENLYRIRRYSAAGRLLLELTLGPQELQARKDAQALQRRFEKSVPNLKAPPGGSVVVRAATSKRVIEGLAEGRDGRIYFLVDKPWEEGDFALDRYDPVTQKVERVLLRQRKPGFLTLAAGKDALVLATVRPGFGPWALDWESLDKFRWTELDEVEIDRRASLIAESTEK